MIPLLVIGAGGQGKVVRELAAAAGGFRLAAIADDRLQAAASDDAGDGLWRGTIEEALAWLARHPDALTVIAIGDNRARMRTAERLGLPPQRYATLIHPTAWVSPSARLGCGTVVLPGAVVHTDAVVGAHAILNSHAVIEHDCRAGDFVHVSPSASLAGGVSLGDGAHVGIGASVLPGLAVGAWSVVGGGAAVTRTVAADAVAVGVPARTIRIQSVLSDKQAQSQ